MTRIVLRPILTLLLLLLILPLSCDACTAIAFGAASTLDSATYTAGTSDCEDCDFRLSKVPARTYPPNSTRPIYLYRGHYPRYVVEHRGTTWKADNLEGTQKQIEHWKRANTIIGYIPQVEKTYALYENGVGYALINEYGITMSESTCPARFVSSPVTHGGHALMDISELSRIAAERATTAKHAVQIMGSLAETYGYYGAAWDDKKNRYEEAGETLMVADAHHVWVFHITPDDTGTSAVWVAQEMPNTDVTVVANSFIIREIDIGDDRFMFSSNVFDVAERNGLWKRGTKLDFTSVYGLVREPARSSYSIHRVWRIFTLLNPSLLSSLDTKPNAHMDGYPFSITPSKKISRDDLFRILRDHYENSTFDLTKGAAAGPYGDPNRYDQARVGGMTMKEIQRGEFGRAISMFRTSSTSLARSKGSLPREVGTMMYLSQQQPSSAAFVPVYMSAEVPRCFTRGSLFRYSNDSMFWAVAAVSNWVHKYYMYAVHDLRRIQAELEDYDVADTDRQAVKLLVKGDMDGAVDVMNRLTSSVAEKIHTRYLSELGSFIGRYHDGLIATNPNGFRIKMQSMFYPKWWLKSVGYFSARETGGSYGGVYEKDYFLAAALHGSDDEVWWRYVSEKTWAVSGSFVMGALLGAVSYVVFGGWMRKVFKMGHSGYEHIP